MLIAICGKFYDIRAGSIRGNGKNISAVYLAYQDYLEGRKVYTNFKTTFSTMIGVNELIDLFNSEELTNCTIIIDEITKYLNNSGVKVVVRKSLIQDFIAESRKADIDIIIMTQRYLQIHKELREHVDIVLIAIKYHFDQEHNCLTGICNYDRCKKRHAIRILSMNTGQFLKENGQILTLDPAIIGKLYNSNLIVKDRFVIENKKKN